LNELKNRSVTDILLAVVDELSGFLDAVFPKVMFNCALYTWYAETCAVRR
jgi:transposase-like protein